MAEHAHIDWLRDRLRASLAHEATDSSGIVAWLEEKRKRVPFSARLIPLRDVANWSRSDDGNISHTSGQFFGIQGVRVRSAPGVREIAEWDQPILTQTEGGVLALICRDTDRGIEFLLQAKADPGNIGYLQFCPTIQSTWENIRGLGGAKPPPFAQCLHPSSKLRIIYRSKHNEEGSRFWQKSNENMILFADSSSALTIPEETHCWASLSQIKQMMLRDNIVGPYVRTVLAPL